MGNALATGRAFTDFRDGWTIRVHRWQSGAWVLESTWTPEDPGPLVEPFVFSFNAVGACVEGSLGLCEDLPWQPRTRVLEVWRGRDTTQPRFFLARNGLTRGGETLEDTAYTLTLEGLGQIDALAEAPTFEAVPSFVTSVLNILGPTTTPTPQWGETNQAHLERAMEGLTNAAWGVRPEGARVFGRPEDGNIVTLAWEDRASGQASGYELPNAVTDVIVRSGDEWETLRVTRARNSPVTDRVLAQASADGLLGKSDPTYDVTASFITDREPSTLALSPGYSEIYTPKLFALSLNVRSFAANAAFAGSSKLRALKVRMKAELISVPSAGAGVATSEVYRGTWISKTPDIPLDLLGDPGPGMEGVTLKPSQSSSVQSASDVENSTLKIVGDTVIHTFEVDSKLLERVQTGADWNGGVYWWQCGMVESGRENGSGVVPTVRMTLEAITATFETQSSSIPSGNLPEGFNAPFVSDPTFQGEHDGSFIPPFEVQDMEFQGVLFTQSAAHATVTWTPGEETTAWQTGARQERRDA